MGTRHSQRTLINMLCFSLLNSSSLLDCDGAEAGFLDCDGAEAGLLKGIARANFCGGSADGTAAAGRFIRPHDNPT